MSESRRLYTLLRNPAFGVVGKVMSAVPLFLLIACVFCQAEDTNGAKSSSQEKPRHTASLDSEGLTYEYIGLRLDDAASKKYDFDGSVGKIRISETLNRENTIYSENLTLKPGCDKFSTITRLPLGKQWLVVLCGNTGGRHQSIKIFKRGYQLLDFRTAALDFENTHPNISYSNDGGFYESAVYKRVLFSDGEYSPREYLMVYKLNIDNTLFGFVPVFGKGVQRSYLDYYAKVKKGLLEGLKRAKKGSKIDNTVRIKEDMGPMAAALLSTMDKDKICSEIPELGTFGLTITDLEKLGQRLTSIGYPSFNFKVCREVLE